MIPYHFFIVLFLGVGSLISDETLGSNSGEAAFFSTLDLERKNMAEVKGAVVRQDWEAAKIAWAKHLKERKAPNWVWSHRDKNKIMSFLKEHGDGLEKSIKKADAVLRREFRFQNIPHTLEKDILWWSKDFRFQWINVLHRHGYWIDLGRAYWQTGDEKYAEDWAAMMKHWIEKNPVQINVGPNPRDRKGQPWRKLETGIRTNVWIESMQFFMDSPAFDSEAKYLFTRSLLDHAHRLVASSQNFRPGNWHQVGVTGLFNLGVMFPEFKDAASWRAMGIEHLKRVMEKGVHPDGAQSELTPGYHSWMALSFLQVQTIGAKNGIDLKGLSERHEKMFEFIMQLTKPDHKYVPVGDAKSRDAGVYMGIGALTYQRPDMKFLAAEEMNPDWIWRFSPDQLLSYSNLISEDPTLGSHMLSHARYGVMRTGWKKEDRFLLFDCAPRGGNHCHDDRLQVVLYSGRDLLIDRGMMNYDNPMQNSYFRRSKAHSVVVLDEKDQPLKSNPELLSWNIDDDFEFASAIVNGKQGVSHQRSVLFMKPDYWIVADHLSGKGEPQLTRLFQIPKVEMGSEGHSAFTKYPDGDNLWISSTDDAIPEIREGYLSHRGNDTISTPTVAFVREGGLPASFGTVLLPFGKKEEIPELRKVDTQDSRLVSVELIWKDGRRDQLVIAATPTELRIGEHRAKGVAMIKKQGEEPVVIEAHSID